MALCSPDTALLSRLGALLAALALLASGCSQQLEKAADYVRAMILLVKDRGIDVATKGTY